MSHYFISTQVHLKEEFCYVDKEPEGTNEYTFKMAWGEEMGDLYPTNARTQFTKRFKGTKLTSLIGNTQNFLIVDAQLKALLERETKAKTEYLALALFDHKNKLASGDYWIINPLGTFDCLDAKQSEIEEVDGEIVAIHKIVLDGKKLQKAPALFRLKQWPASYVVNERLMAEIKKLNPTNVVFSPVEGARF